MKIRKRRPEDMNRREGGKASFETSDLNLASFLRCRNFMITAMTAQGGRTVFVFEESSSLQGAILDFANDAAVPVRSFTNTLRDLKALTYSTQQPAGMRAAGLDGM